MDPSIDVESLSRPSFNKALKNLFTNNGWKSEVRVFEKMSGPDAKLDFVKERVGIEVGFAHGSNLGIDLLKLQVSSYSGLDNIDVGVLVTTTSEFQKQMRKQYNQNWEGSLTFEKVVRYLPHFKSAIQVPIYVLGIDM